MKMVVCLHPLGWSRLDLLEGEGFCLLGEELDMLKWENFMVVQRRAKGKSLQPF